MGQGAVGQHVTASGLSGSPQACRKHIWCLVGLGCSEELKMPSCTRRGWEDVTGAGIVPESPLLDLIWVSLYLNEKLHFAKSTFGRSIKSSVLINYTYSLADIGSFSHR